MAEGGTIGIITKTGRAAWSSPVVRQSSGGLQPPSSASSKASGETRTAVAQTSRVLSDSWITPKVTSEILANSASRGCDVSGEMIHGVLVLKGALAHHEAVGAMKDRTERVGGVKSRDTSARTVAGK
jgi:hyperosmotically inducible protein